MTDVTKIPLISTEITGLWNSYISDTMLVCVLKFYLNRVEDSETQAIIKQTLDLSNKHVEEVTNIFNKSKENIS